MNTILNGKATKSQPLDTKDSSESSTDISEHINTIKEILYSRDKVDLLLLEYILKINIQENRNVSVENAMAYMKMSNPPLSVRLRRMRDPGAGNIEIALLKAVKNGNPFFYRFTDVIPLEEALSLVQGILKRKGISYENYCAEKKLVAEQNSKNNEEGCEEESDTSGEDLEVGENKTDGEAPPEVNFDELSSIVTMREVLEMIDEASQNISQNIIETLTETFVQILDEKVDEINTRVTELEQKFSQINIPKVNKESREELVQRVRLLVRQKLSSKIFERG